MTHAISAPTATAALLIAVAMAPAAAAPPVSLDGGVPAEPRIIPAQYSGDATGSHHRRNRGGGEVSKSVAPSHADLHGATRESADKAYRKQYGF